MHVGRSIRDCLQKLLSLYITRSLYIGINAHVTGVTCIQRKCEDRARIREARFANTAEGHWTYLDLMCIPDFLLEINFPFPIPDKNWFHSDVLWLTHQAPAPVGFWVNSWAILGWVGALPLAHPDRWIVTESETFLIRSSCLPIWETRTEMTERILEKLETELPPNMRVRWPAPAVLVRKVVPAPHL